LAIANILDFLTIRLKGPARTIWMCVRNILKITKIYCWKTKNPRVVFSPQCLDNITCSCVQ